MVPRKICVFRVRILRCFPRRRRSQFKVIEASKEGRKEGSSPSVCGEEYATKYFKVRPIVCVIITKTKKKTTTSLRFGMVVAATADKKYTTTTSETREEQPTVNNIGKVCCCLVCREAGRPVARRRELRKPLCSSI